MGEFTGIDLACVRAERSVFRRLSFRLADGGCLVLFGANGSGKSSLLRIMAGLLRPAAGRLVWHDGALADEGDGDQPILHYVGHLDGVKPTLTVLETATFWARFQGGSEGAGARVQRALETFGLTRLGDVPGRYLSAGQRRRLALCRLLAAPARLWLLDEPATALDSDAEGRLADAIAAHRRGGGMVALSLHGAEWPPDADGIDLDRAAAAAREDDAC